MTDMFGSFFFYAVFRAFCPDYVLCGGGIVSLPFLKILLIFRASWVLPNAQVNNDLEEF